MLSLVIQPPWPPSEILPRRRKTDFPNFTEGLSLLSDLVQMLQAIKAGALDDGVAQVRAATAEMVTAMGFQPLADEFAAYVAKRTAELDALEAEARAKIVAVELQKADLSTKNNLLASRIENLKSIVAAT